VKIGIIPENLVERLALALGLVPAPAIEAWFSFMLARAIMAGTKLGVFEALADGPLACDEVAERYGTDRRATAKLAQTQHSRHQPQSSGLQFAEEPEGEEKVAGTD